MSAQWCFDSCLHCGRVVDSDASYCSLNCQQAAATVLPPVDHDDSDDEYEDPWLRVSLWAQGVHPIPPPPPERAVYTSPSKRILTPQYSTACLTSHSTVARHTTSPPRPAQRTSPTATESLVASSTSAASSLGGLYRSWAPAQRPQLPRLTTTHFTVFAKAHESASADSDASPLWALPKELPSSKSSKPPPRAVVHGQRPPPRGRRPAPATS
ncbi:hypothetical protein C8R45DRAFT_1098701 [Mycena sanguinolenta]|nr:hypothetical protein C8R45DRAFT_1098701 [Mycena sanguinolenta]